MRQKIEWDKPILPIFMLYLSFSVYLITVFVLVQSFVQYERVKIFSQSVIDSSVSISESISDLNEEFDDNDLLTSDNNDETYTSGTSGSTNNGSGDNYLEVNLSNSLSANSDTVGWIVVNGTKVNYPVVQSGDNSYYLTHDFYGKESVTGWIFGDYRNDFSTFNKNTIIYGHNLINKSMFGSLTQLLKSSWYSKEANHFIKFNTKEAKTVWKIFSVYIIEPETYYLTTRFSEETFARFLTVISERSIYSFDTELDVSDKILTLQTCNDSGNKRVVVHAKLIKYQEG